MQEDSAQKSTFWRDTIIVVVITCILSFLAQQYVYQIFEVPSGSMEQTVKIGDRIIVNKLYGQVKRGNIIVFKDADGWLNAGEGHYLLKRVIGVGGDTIECDSDTSKIKVNGAPITEPYLKKGAEPCGTTFTIKVPKDHVWVMGDNRDDSDDSRYHRTWKGNGYIKDSNIVGVAWFVIFPNPRTLPQ